MKYFYFSIAPYTSVIEDTRQVDSRKKIDVKMDMDTVHTVIIHTFDI